MTSPTPPRHSRTSKHPPEMIALGRTFYAKGMPVAEIGKRTSIPHSTLYHHLGVKPPKGGASLPPIPLRRDQAMRVRRASAKTSRPALIARLWSTAERQVAEIETRLIEAGGDAATLERDAKTLSVLARTVRDLVALDEAGKAKNNRSTTEVPDGEGEAPRDLDAFRRALAEKLEEIGALEADN